MGQDRIRCSRCMKDWVRPIGLAYRDGEPTELFECPACGGRTYCELRSRWLFQCNACRRQTSPIAGTIFASTHVPLLSLALWDIEPEAIRRQLQEILSTAMGRLSAEHRAVVDLTYFHEAGYREIAEILDCPVGTVKTRMLHARKRLKDMLADQFGADGW